MAWDVTGRSERGSLRSDPLDNKALERRWTELADEDASRAFDAVWSLVASPNEALPFLRKRLPALSDAQVKQIDRLISELDDDAFAVRQRATEKLESLGAVAEPALRKRLEGKPSFEVRQRAEALLEKILVPERLPKPLERRALRLIEALEQIGTREAKEALQRIADQGLRAQLRQEARASLLRLAKPLASSR
jgi:hypothetical protein